MKTTIILLAFLITSVSYSQTNQDKENPQPQKQETQKTPVKNIEIKGLVINSVTEKPIQMSFVMVAGTNIGTLTDQDGNFVIQAPETAKQLSFSADGYKSQKIDIDAKKEMKVKLVPKDK